MQTEFANVVDPIFQLGLDSLRRMERGEACDPFQLQSEILTVLDRADLVLGASKQWELARYAIAAWMDELFLNTPWDGAHWWRDHILEMKLFQTRLCNQRFFELAREASSLTCRDALEVFYNCVLLGFRGMYGNPDFDRSNSAQQGMPETIEHWLDQTSKMIDFAPTGPWDEPDERTIEGARPLSTKRQVLWWSVAALLLLLINGALLQMHFSSR